MQTTYTQYPSDRRRGMRANTIEQQTKSKFAAVAVRHGAFVMRSGSDNKCAPPTSTGAVTATGHGFAAWDPGRSPNAVAPEYYAIGDDVPVLIEGEIYVYSETAQAYGAQFFVRFTTGVPADGSDLGQIRNDADTAKAVALPGWRIDETISAAGLVRISGRMTDSTG